MIRKVALKTILGRFGYQLSRCRPRVEFLEIVDLLKPVRTIHGLIRIGGSHDGGYLVPDDLSGVVACLSPGVSDCVEFEQELIQYGICSHLADWSVDAPKDLPPSCSFTKKHIGPFNDSRTMTIESWIKDVDLDHGDLMLQMDIEGAEYATLLNMSDSVLERLRIIVVEFHFMDRLFDPYFRSVVYPCLKRLHKRFAVVHIHPNNACGVVRLQGLDIPRMLEITYLRRDRVGTYDPATEFPHSLDRPCVAGPELHLPRYWFQGS